MLFFEANAADPVQEWSHIGFYQNTTLRYSPGVDFPPHLEKMLGRPKIVRCFVTLDDAWDYRTGEYKYDYVLGFDPYKDDPNMHRYDRGDHKMSPYEMTMIPYLTSHAQHAEYVMFTVRRYEREVANGIVSLDKYEEVLEHLLEYYKNLVPNIRYVEGNEWNIPPFGGLTAFESYELYKRMYRVVNRLNRKHQYEIPLEVGGPTNAGSNDDFKYYEQFLRFYKLDTDPEKKLDFYASHEYTTDMTLLEKFYLRHKDLIKKMDLPDLPIFFNEYGTECFSPDIYHNQLNAAASVEMFISLNKYKDFHVFPWCTYHDPSLQVSHCMFIDFDRTCDYLPTFLGQAHLALSKLLDGSLPLSGNIGNHAVVTTDGEKYVVLATNQDKKAHNIRFRIANLPGAKMKVEAYKVDALHNNCFIDRSVNNLQVTDAWESGLEDGKLAIADTLDALGFTLWIIQPCE